MLGNNFTLHDVLRLYSDQYWPSLADKWCSVNTAKSVVFFVCLFYRVVALANLEKV